ncbi:retrovirus-related pol polyprotein from transposon TNT 1-94 [Tanacetum coccineum]
MSRTMLNEQSLPQKFWCNAVDTSTYILNRILIRAILGKTPYELLRGRKPTLDYFRVFGSKCFILNTKDYLTKFDPKSYEGVFLGYSQNSKAYIILNKHTRKVEESLNVTFDETPPPSKTSPLTPKNVNEALGDESWIVAMQEELYQSVANDIWELVPQPRNMTIIGTKWVFRNKLDENGIVSRNKARLVAQGYNQQEGIDYDETYAPVARLESIRILLAYACALDFKLFQMDVKSAFLNGFINEEVYVAQPPGFIDFEKPDHVYKLKKALYGLKQAPKAWYDRLKAFLIKHEYKMGMVDNTLFTKKKSSNLIIVQIYVDDIIFEMLKKFGLEEFKPMKTPMSFDTKLTKDEEYESVDSTKYRGMIVPIASPTLSLFHDDPYMKVMQAFYAEKSPIPPPTIIPQSSMLNPQEFFLPEGLLPPKKRSCSSSSTSALPQDFEIGESSRKTSLECYEEQIEEILNHLDELSLDSELQQARAQISKLQKKQMGNDYKISLARFRITDLEHIINDIQIHH